MVGSAFVRGAGTRGLDVVGVDRAGMDVTDAEAVGRVVRAWAGAGVRSTTDWIVHCAAFTAVDRAEGEPLLAEAVNEVAPGVLAHEAARLGAAIVHYSTDYVFDGSQTTPYAPEDPPNPLNVYGRTKLAGERAIADSGASHLILRTTGPAVTTCKL